MLMSRVTWDKISPFCGVKSREYLGRTYSCDAEESSGFLESKLILGHTGVASLISVIYV